MTVTELAMAVLNEIEAYDPPEDAGPSAAERVISKIEKLCRNALLPQPLHPQTVESSVEKG